MRGRESLWPTTIPEGSSHKHDQLRGRDGAPWIVQASQRQLTPSEPPLGVTTPQRQLFGMLELYSTMVIVEMSTIAETTHKSSTIAWSRDDKESSDPQQRKTGGKINYTYQPGGQSPATHLGRRLWEPAIVTLRWQGKSFHYLWYAGK